MHFKVLIDTSTAILAKRFNMFDDQSLSLWVRNDIDSYSPTKVGMDKLTCVLSLLLRRHISHTI
jgi:hypothetical protein